LILIIRGLKIMLTSEDIKKAAVQYGADLCGIGDITGFDKTPPSRNPRMILPGAKAVVGFGFRIPESLYENMGRGKNFFAYTSLGLKAVDEEVIQVLLMRMAALIEDEGYDACLQRSTPNLKIPGDPGQNPEVLDTVTLEGARSVGEGKPPPEVILDFTECARICGLGHKGLSGHILTPRFGPYVRFCFIITDMPLDPDSAFMGNLCDSCGDYASHPPCVAACPGKAIDSRKGLDTWQCSVYYRGAGKINPLMKSDFLAEDAERDDILNGKKRFDAISARTLYPGLDFLPGRVTGYAPCLCGKACDRACREHLKGAKII
jgi:ferredoxin